MNLEQKLARHVLGEMWAEVRQCRERWRLRRRLPDIASAALIAALCAVVPAAYAAAPSDQQPTTATITLLGTYGGPGYNQRRSETSVLLTVNKHQYLIDAGPGTWRRINEDAVHPYTLRHIFITHDHLDHTAGLVSLMSEMWFQGWYKAYGPYLSKTTQPFVTIYGPPGTGAIFNAAMSFLKVSATIFDDGETGHGTMKMPDEVFREQTVTPGHAFYDDGTVSVSAVTNTHFKFPPGSAAARAGYKSYSYRFDTKAGAIVFTGDTGPSANVQRLAEGAKVLVSEVLNLKLLEKRNPRAFNPKLHKGVEKLIEHMETEHLSPKDIGTMATKDHVKTVILYHVVPGSPPSTYASFVRGVKKYFSGQVIMGQDLMQYTIVGK